MEYFLIYFLQIADVFEILKVLCICAAVLVLLIWFIAICSSNGDILESNEEVSGFKKWLFGFVVAGCIFAFVPTKQTMILCAGYHYGKQAVSTVAASETAKKVTLLVNTELDNYINKAKQNHQ